MEQRFYNRVDDKYLAMAQPNAIIIKAAFIQRILACINAVRYHREKIRFIKIQLREEYNVNYRLIVAPC